ncbi:MAG: hypothetical protein M3P70_13460 [Actinomycetota bacterium]|nr:hypothetical protein [Actinomycetota bacterium]
MIGGGTVGPASAAGGALVECNKLGGDCLYRGCVLTKALVKSARVASPIDRSEAFGIKTAGYEVDFPAVTDRMERVMATGDLDNPERYCKLVVDVFTDKSRFGTPVLVAVDGQA